MSRPISIGFSTVSEDHQRIALFQTKVHFWAYFAGVWITLALGLIPIAFLLIIQPEPLTLKITAIGLSLCFEMFSLCFARSLKETRKWLDAHYDRLCRNEDIVQARDIVDKIENKKLRDEMKAEITQCLLRVKSPAQADDCIRKILLQRFFPRNGAP